MNVYDLLPQRELGIGGSALKFQGSNYWTRRNCPEKRQFKFYDPDEKFPTKSLISGEENIGEFTCVRLPHLLKPRRIDIGRANKVFASQWLDENSVILGTKCNQLLVADLSSGGQKWKNSVSQELFPKRRKRNHQGQLLACAGRRAGKSMIQIPTLKSSANSKWNLPVNMVDFNDRSHSGVHTIKMNPSGTLIATGGHYPSDVGVYALPEFRPVAIGEAAHADWLFDLEWLDDEYAISGSRDSILALWRFQDHIEDEFAVDCPHTRWLTSTTGAKYQAVQPVTKRDMGRGAGSVDKIRALAYNHRLRNVAVVSLNSKLALVDLHTMDMTSLKGLAEADFSESVCMCLGADESLLAVGSKSHFSFFDARSLRQIRDVPLPSPSRDQRFDDIYPGLVPAMVPSGVRSISWRGPLVTLGTGAGDILFYDVRGNGTLLTCPGNCCPNKPTILNVGSGWLRQDEGVNEYLPNFPLNAAVYTHCYDSSGARLLAAGGPIAASMHGNYAAVWQ